MDDIVDVLLPQYRWRYGRRETVQYLGLNQFFEAEVGRFGWGLISSRRPSRS